MEARNNRPQTEIYDRVAAPRGPQATPKQGLGRFSKRRRGATMPQQRRPGDPLSPKEWRKKNPPRARLSGYAATVAVAGTLGRHQGVRAWHKETHNKNFEVHSIKERTSASRFHPLHSSRTTQKEVVRKHREMARYTLLSRDAPAVAGIAFAATLLLSPNTARTIAADTIALPGKAANAVSDLVRGNGNHAASSSPTNEQSSHNSASSIVPLSLAAGHIVCTGPMVKVTLAPADRGQALAAINRVERDPNLNYTRLRPPVATAYIKDIELLNGTPGHIAQTFNAPTKCSAS